MRGLIKSCLDESLLVLRGLGVQTSTSSSTYLSTSTTRFIPTAQIQDIVIHEAFKGMEVRFYLAIIVEGATEVVVVFPVGSLLSFVVDACCVWWLILRRISCLSGRFLKKSGEVPENVSMILEWTRLSGPLPFLWPLRYSYSPW